MLRLIATLGILSALLLPAHGAFAEDEAVRAPLEAGLAQRDITPPMGYGMSGYYHARGADGVRDPLHAKAIVLRQGKVQAALVVCDLIGITSELSGAVRKQVSARTAIPEGHIIVAATHAHTGPSYAGHLRRFIHEGKDDGYASKLVDGVAGAVLDAHEKLAPAELRSGAARQETPIAFCRRFVMKDGSVRTWANYRNAQTVREEGPIDPEVGMILIQKPGARRPQGAIVNFALHLDTLGGSKWSADFPHDLEESLRKVLGENFLSVFAAGCCGDINHVNPRTPYRNKTPEIGQALGVTVKAALPSLRPMAEPALAIRRAVIHPPLQDVSAEELARADELIQQDKAGKKLPFLEEVRAYKQRKVVSLRKQAEKAGHPGTLAIEVQAVRLDAETAIVAIPGEVFVELGLAIKRRSPFKTTLVIELSNRNETIYIPTRLAYTGGGYEVTNSVLKPGSGETMVETAVGLLQDLARPERN